MNGEINKIRKFSAGFFSYRNNLTLKVPGDVVHDTKGKM